MAGVILAEPRAVATPPTLQLRGRLRARVADGRPWAAMTGFGAAF